jgi:hypothetical protein
MQCGHSANRKLGRRRSVTHDQSRSVYDPRRQGSYTAKSREWIPALVRKSACRKLARSGPILGNGEEVLLSVHGNPVLTRMLTLAPIGQGPAHPKRRIAKPPIPHAFEAGFSRENPADYRRMPTRQRRIGFLVFEQPKVLREVRRFIWRGDYLSAGFDL